jgi:hypothetical protein
MCPRFKSVIRHQKPSNLQLVRGFLISQFINLDELSFMRSAFTPHFLAQDAFSQKSR